MLDHGQLLKLKINESSDCFKCNNEQFLYESYRYFFKLRLKSFHIDMVMVTDSLR